MQKQFIIALSFAVITGVFSLTDSQKNKHNNNYESNISVSNKNIRHKIEACINYNRLGISPKVIGIIFQPFFITPSTGQEKGVSLFKRYAFIKDGELDINTNKDEGIVLIVALPV